MNMKRFYHFDFSLVLSTWFYYCVHANTASINGDHSCRSNCSQSNAPRCGVWMQDYNTDKLSGIYVLNEAEIELHCAVTSQPTLADIRWFSRRADNSGKVEFYFSEPKLLTCSSLRTNTNCDPTGEHSTKSFCNLKIDSLDLTGSYYCQATVEGGYQVQSAEAKLNVYGIAPVIVVDSILPSGSIGHVTIEVCANPKPEVTWVSTARDSDVRYLVTSKSNHPSAVVLPLQKAIVKSTNDRAPQSHQQRSPVSPTTNNNHNNNNNINNNNNVSHVAQPAHHKRFCYLSQLILAQVDGVSAKYWTVVTSNSVATTKTALQSHLRLYRTRYSHAHSYRPSWAMLFTSFMSIVWMLFVRL